MPGRRKTAQRRSKKAKEHTTQPTLQRRMNEHAQADTPHAHGFLFDVASAVLLAIVMMMCFSFYPEIYRVGAPSGGADYEKLVISVAVLFMVLFTFTSAYGTWKNRFKLGVGKLRNLFEPAPGSIPSPALACEKSHRKKRKRHQNRVARYQEGVTDESMRQIMKVLHESDSWNTFQSNVSALDEKITANLNAHLRSIVSFLALNKGEKMPGWFHNNKNDAVRGIFKDVTLELESNASLAGLLNNENNLSDPLDGVCANPLMVMVIFLCNYEPNSLRFGRLCPQMFCYRGDDQHKTWVFAHRCHQVLINAFAMAGQLYGLDLDVTLAVARSIVVFTNRLPVDGDSNWTRSGILPRTFLLIANITDKIMRRAFRRLPRVFPNLVSVCLFGGHTHEARGRVIPDCQQVANTGPLPHPTKLVAPFSLPGEDLSIVNTFLAVWALLLGIDEPIVLPQSDTRAAAIIAASKFTGCKVKGGSKQYYLAWYHFTYEAKGTQEEMLASVEIKFPGSRELIEKRLEYIARNSFTETRRPYLVKRMSEGLSVKFVTKSSAENKDLQYCRMYYWISRLRDGANRAGEKEIIDELESEFGIPIRDKEEIERVRREAQSASMSSFLGNLLSAYSS